MFSGIISAVGSVLLSEPLGEGKDFGVRLTVQTPSGFCDDVALGDSIAINGACMTVVHIDKEASRFQIEVSQESLSRTSGFSVLGASVNLEKSLRMGATLDGHLVTGHIDSIGMVYERSNAGESLRVRIGIPSEFSKFVAVKGSIAINGASLTINALEDVPTHTILDVNLIPYTTSHTTLGDLEIGQPVNFEIDLLARYCARIMDCQRPRC